MRGSQAGDRFLPKKARTGIETKLSLGVVTVIGPGDTGGSETKFSLGLVTAIGRGASGGLKIVEVGVRYPLVLEKSRGVAGGLEMEIELGLSIAGEYHIVAGGNIGIGPSNELVELGMLCAGVEGEVCMVLWDSS